MEMSGERIGIVLVRASELHSKIANCIQKSSLHSLQNFNNTNNNNVNGDINDDDDDNLSEEVKLDVNGDDNDGGGDDDDADADTDALFTICDAFHSLESHLSSLQALQQQQQYEREAAIRDIEYNRKLLLKKLSEYKGEHMDVIREAEAFASMKVESDNELLLPLYPTVGLNSLASDTGGLRSRVSNSPKLVQNGHYNRDESKKSETQNSSRKLWGGLRFLLSSTAQTMLTLVGVISILSLAGFEPKLKKKSKSFTALTLNDSEDKRLRARCPPGKVAVVDNGEVHCIVKERVEIPFDSVAADPDVNYGCG